MSKIHAKISQSELPLWATLERKLIDVINQTPEYVMEKYVKPDGSLYWPTTPDFQSIDGLDDAYESFHNWPIFYMCGGDEKFLRLSHREYDAITEQFSHVGSGHGHPMVVDEYEQGYDWMHQGEGYLFFNMLNMADPADQKNRERAIRYAALYTGENKNVNNYDAEKKMMRSCYLGSKGEASRNFGQYWGGDWKYYGLPFYDVPGAHTVADIKDREISRRMGTAMRDRLAHSDTAINLFATTLVMNAFLHTGERKYADWIDEYANAWRQRTIENGGIMPDNVGPDGKIGGAIDGKWWGGYYGWTWPHGFYFIGEAMVTASQNQCLLHGDTSLMDWPRQQVKMLVEKGELRDGTLYVPNKYADPGAHIEFCLHLPGYDALNGQALPTDGKKTDVEGFVKYYSKDGWFEYAPMTAVTLAHIYSMAQDPADIEIVRKLRNHQRPDWDRIRMFYSKDQGGHEAAWLEYLSGCYDCYPEEILQHAIMRVYGRMKQMREDTQDRKTYGDAYLQARNPVNVEALVQLSTGGLPPIYNGGLLVTPIRHFDAENKRPGLPEDVAALVSKVDGESITVTLVNTSPIHARTVVMGAGGFGEHQFVRASFQEPDGEEQATEIDDCWLSVTLEPAAIVTMKIEMKRFVNQPGYKQPW